MTGSWHIRTLIGILAMVALALTTVGCQAQPAEWPELGDHRQGPSPNQTRPTNTRGLHVVAGSSRYVTQLQASDVIKIMRSIGCSNEQILEIGTDLHDALAQRGAAQIMMGKNIEASMQVGKDQVLISSVTRGMFIYDLRRGEIGLPNFAPGRSMPR